MFVFLSPILNFPERVLKFAKISQNKIIIDSFPPQNGAIQYFREREVNSLVNQLDVDWHFAKYCSEKNSGSGGGRQ